MAMYHATSTTRDAASTYYPDLINAHYGWPPAAVGTGTDHGDNGLQQHSDAANVPAGNRDNVEDHPPRSDDSAASVSNRYTGPTPQVPQVGNPMAGSRNSSTKTGVVGGPKTEAAAEARRGKNYKPAHACKICSRQFATTTNAKRHILSHFGIKPWRCQCSKRFTTEQDLQRHTSGNRHDTITNRRQWWRDHVYYRGVDDDEKDEAKMIIKENLIKLKGAVQ